MDRSDLRKSIIACIALIALGALYWKMWAPIVTQTKRSLSFRDAQKKCPIPLPPEARNVQYAVYADWQVYQAFVRFEVPYDIGVSHANTVFQEHAKMMKWPFRAPVGLTIKSPPQMPFSPFPELTIDWFDVGQIRRGETFGESNSWQPQVWVDADRNLFFFCLSD